MLKTISRLSLVAAAIGLLSACQTLGVAPPLVSAVTIELPDGASRAIAVDIAAQLKMQLGVGTTSIRLRGEGSVFGEALEGALRDLGFAVGSENSLAQSPPPVDLAYLLDGDETKIYVRVSVGTLELTRSYRSQADAVIPIGPVSVLQTSADQNG
jgi:hypothetical protein